MTPHKKLGGLGLFDPGIQQKKSKRCWVVGLLLPASILTHVENIDKTFLHICIPYIKYGLCLISQDSSSFLWPLLFLSRRKPFLSLRTNTFKPLFSLVDALPNFSLESARLSAATLLQFDLQDIIVPNAASGPDQLS